MEIYTKNLILDKNNGHKSKTKNSNLPEISRGDLKQLLQNIRNMLKIGKLTSAKKYKIKSHMMQ